MDDSAEGGSISTIGCIVLKNKTKKKQNKTKQNPKQNKHTSQSRYTAVQKTTKIWSFQSSVVSTLTLLFSTGWLDFCGIQFYNLGYIGDKF